MIAQFLHSSSKCVSFISENGGTHGVGWDGVLQSQACFGAERNGRLPIFDDHLSLSWI